MEEKQYCMRQLSPLANILHIFHTHMFHLLNYSIHAWIFRWLSILGPNSFWVLREQIFAGSSLDSEKNLQSVGGWPLEYASMPIKVVQTSDNITKNGGIAALNVVLLWIHSRKNYSQVCSNVEKNVHPRSSWKMDAWKTILSYWVLVIFQGAKC